MKIVLGTFKDNGEELADFLEPRVGAKLSVGGGELTVDDDSIKKTVNTRHVKTYVKRFLWKKGERRNYRVLVQGKELTLIELEPSEAEKEERLKREEREEAREEEEEEAKGKEKEGPAEEGAPEPLREFGGALGQPSPEPVLEPVPPAESGEEAQKTQAEDENVAEKRAAKQTKKKAKKPASKEKPSEPDASPAS